MGLGAGSGIRWTICNNLHLAQITTPAPHHSVIYRLDALPGTKPSLVLACTGCPGKHTHTPALCPGLPG